MVVVMHMQKRYKQALQFSGAILALVSIITVTLGAVPRGTLLDWGKKAALFSAGIQQPEGGAEALSERLERQPAQGQEGNSGETGTSSGGTAATQPPPSTADQDPNIEVMVPSIDPPPNDGSGGKVSEQQMSIGSEFVQGVAIRNKSGKNIDVAAQLAIKPNITIKENGEPQVLIMHTHTTEAYMKYYAGYYIKGDGGRTQDNSFNVVAAGNAMAAQLEAAGIRVLHDITVHDYPKYTGAYDRSAATVEKILKEHPSIQVVIDLHRDGIMLNSVDKVKPTVTINGRKAAQVMIITGVVSTDKLPHPDWQENLRLTLRLQQALHTNYEGLARALSITSSRYNQHLSKGAMLIEMGSEANTIEEAVYSAQVVGKTLADVLKTLE